MTHRSASLLDSSVLFPLGDSERVLIAGGGDIDHIAHATTPFEISAAIETIRSAPGATSQSDTEKVR